MGTELLIPPTCVENPGYWTCEATDNSFIVNIITKYGLARQNIFDYNTEYIDNNYSSLGMKVRVPNVNLTRICVPGNDYFCVNTVEGDNLWSVAEYKAYTDAG